MGEGVVAHFHVIVVVVFLFVVWSLCCGVILGVDRGGR